MVAPDPEPYEERRPTVGREVEFDPEHECDNCECIGAFDFMGDYLCKDCAKEYIVDDGVDEEYYEEAWGE